jgi:hypothetical protein
MCSGSVFITAWAAPWQPAKKSSPRASRCAFTDTGTSVHTAAVMYSMGGRVRSHVSNTCPLRFQILRYPKADSTTCTRPRWVRPPSADAMRASAFTSFWSRSAV